jgi:HSP20 family molecular chaperone IbpA
VQGQGYGTIDFAITGTGGADRVKPDSASMAFRVEFGNRYVIDDTIDCSKINASLEKGILTLTLGIKESEKPRKINVVAK